MKPEDIEILKNMRLSGPVMTQIRICQAIRSGKTKEVIADDLRVSIAYVYKVQRDKCPSCNPFNKM